MTESLTGIPAPSSENECTNSAMSDAKTEPKDEGKANLEPMYTRQNAPADKWEPMIPMGASAEPNNTRSMTLDSNTSITGEERAKLRSKETEEIVQQFAAKSSAGPQYTRLKPLSASIITKDMSRAALEPNDAKPNTFSRSIGPRVLVKGGTRTLKTETRIVLIGENGSGKSSTGNMLLGQNTAFIAKISKKPVTEKCDCGQASLPDREIIIIDTPGNFGTGMAEEDVKTEIAKCYGLVCPGPHAILLTIPVDTRHSKDARAAFEQILVIFGKEINNYVLPVFTKADQLERNLATEKSFLQKKDSDLAYILQECEDRYVFVDNTVRLKKEKDAQRNKILAEIDRMAVSNLHFKNEYLKEVGRVINDTKSMPKTEEKAVSEESMEETVPKDSQKEAETHSDSREKVTKKLLVEEPSLIQTIKDILRYLWLSLFGYKTESQSSI